MPKFTKRSITQPQIVRLRSNLVQNLITWHPLHYRRSRSSVKSQGRGVKTSSDRQIIAIF